MFFIANCLNKTCLSSNQDYDAQTRYKHLSGQKAQLLVMEPMLKPGQDHYEQQFSVAGTFAAVAVNFADPAGRSSPSAL